MTSKMAVNLAQRRLDDFQNQCRDYGETALHLAYHAALPVALNAELLHLIRINFFLDSSTSFLPYIVESRFLLSSLCHEVEEGLYEIEPEIRDFLLERLIRIHGISRIRDIATLLWQYVNHYSPWLNREELKRAQQLTALNFLNPGEAKKWLDETQNAVSTVQPTTREWFVAVKQEIEMQSRLIRINIQPKISIYQSDSQPFAACRFPDLVAMKVGLEEIDSSSKKSLSAQKGDYPWELELLLSISFSGEQEVEIPAGMRLGLPGGRATFGICRGQLRFELGNCKLPYEKTALLKPFNVSIDVERQRTRVSKMQVGMNTSDRSLRERLDVFQVKRLGAEESPAWIFETGGEDIVLDGLLKKTLLGILQIDGLPCTLKASFTARGEDIRLTWGELGLTQNIHRNKLAVIERAIVLRYFKSLVESKPLCEVTWEL